MARMNVGGLGAVRRAAVLFCAALGAGAAAHADTLLVSNRGDGTVGVYDTDAKKLTATVPAGVGAHEFAVSPDGRTVVGSLYGSGPQHQVPDNRLMVVDLDNLTGVRLIDLGDNPRPNDMRFLDAGTLVVTSEVRERLLLVDVADGEIDASIPFGQSAGHMLAVSPDESRAYVPSVRSGVVSVVSLDPTATERVIGTVQTAFGAEGVDASPDGKRVWVACHQTQAIMVIDAEKLEVTQTIQTDGFPFRVRFTPDGSRVIVAHPGAHELRIYDVETGEVTAEAELPGGQPTSLAVSPDGASVFAVCGPVSKIAEIEVQTGKVVHWYDTGAVPDAIAVVADE